LSRQAQDAKTQLRTHNLTRLVIEQVPCLLYALDTEWWWHTAILHVSDTRNRLRLW